MIRRDDRSTQLDRPRIRGPTVGGLLSVAWSLVTPARFVATPPKLRGLRVCEWLPDRASWRPPRADVYLPEGPGPYPTVLLIPGGAFLVGGRRMKAVRILATHLLAAGHAVVVGDYRTVARGGHFRAMRADVEELVRWTLGSAARLNLDLHRLTLCGISAGATLALLAADQFPVGTFRRLVSIFGVYDLALMQGPVAHGLRPLVFRSRPSPDALHGHSPIRGGALPVAPLTLLHGTDDRLVPFEQAELFLAQRREAGWDAQLIAYPGAPHGFFNDSRSPVCSRALRDLLDVII